MQNSKFGYLLILSLFLPSFLLLSGCGVKGSLYFPADEKTLLTPKTKTTTKAKTKTSQTSSQNLKK